MLVITQEKSTANELLWKTSNVVSGFELRYKNRKRTVCCGITDLPDEYLTVPEIAAIIGCDQNYCYRLLQRAHKDQSVGPIRTLTFWTVTREQALQLKAQFEARKSQPRAGAGRPKAKKG